MESDIIILNLKEYISNLDKINYTPGSEEEEKEKQEQETLLVQKVVDCFDIILSNNFIIKENNDIPQEKNNYYYSLIIKHFNTPLIRFFIVYNESSSINNDTKEKNLSEKNWIFLSILENSFSDCINEIYKQNLEKKYYRENSLLRKYKSDIKKILKHLNYMEFKYTKNSDFDKYLEFLKDQSISTIEENYIINVGSIIPGNINSPVSDISIIKKIEAINPNKKDKENQDENFDLQIIKNISDSVTNNFYKFIPEQKEKSVKEYKKLINEEINTNNIENISSKNNNILDQSQDDEDINSNSNISNSNSDSEDDDDQNMKSKLQLNPIHYKYLPSDNLYQVKAKSEEREYNQKDELIYNKKLTPMSNSHLLYLNHFYKKALYHKFYKNNLHQTPITLKAQNFQCFICLKKFSMLFNKFPLESIYWCSYYLRFICKNCVDREYSVIPFFILSNWSFEKYPISKRAKMLLEKWYDKPVIYFKNDEGLIKDIPGLAQVVKIKTTMNYIFDKMKCENKMEYIINLLGEYKYLVLKETIFSIRDLVEINSKVFLKKINDFFNAMIRHVSGECDMCLIEGENCRCGSDEKLFLYDYKNVFYCPNCDICYHRKCKGIFLGCLCGNQ